ncbi:MAG: rod-binding protein [Lachnospiraceae bacterium]|nr:rod-binding protein [Lachnospiraceae bacterium]
MDISSNLYTQLNNQSAVSDALSSKVKDAAGKNYDKASDAELMDACKQFESYFIEQVYKKMWDTVPESEYSSQATSTLVDYYKGEMIKTMADETSDQSGLGIANMLYQQMKRNVEGVVSAADIEAKESGSVENSEAADNSEDQGSVESTGA